MQEEMNKAMSSLQETVGADVPTFSEVEQKIQARYAKAKASAELNETSVESRVLEIEQATANVEAQSRLSQLRAELGLDAVAPAAAPAIEHRLRQVSPARPEGRRDERCSSASCSGPIVELYVMYLVATWIGFWSMLGLLILLSIVGCFVIRFAGVRTLRRYIEQSETVSRRARSSPTARSSSPPACCSPSPASCPGCSGWSCCCRRCAASLRNQLSKRTAATATSGSTARGFRDTTVIATYERDEVQDVTATEVRRAAPRPIADPSTNSCSDGRRSAAGEGEVLGLEHRAEQPAIATGGTASATTRSAMRAEGAGGSRPVAVEHDRLPASPPSATAGSIGTWPSSGAPISSASAWPPPVPNRAWRLPWAQ